MSPERQRQDEVRHTIHPELLTGDDHDAIYRQGRRLDHAEGSSKPLRGKPEPQPRGAKIHGMPRGSLASSRKAE